MKANEPMSDDMLTDDEREIITEEYIRSVKRELAEALAEIDRLRIREQALAAENAAMRPVVEAVAEHIGGYVSEHFRQCAFCGNGALESRVIAHANDCEVEQARAFVAAHPATAAAAGEAESEGE